MFDFETIQAAVSGDDIAMKKVVRHYKSYMITVLARQEADEYGRIRAYVDPDDLEELTQEFEKAVLGWKPLEI